MLTRTQVAFLLAFPYFVALTDSSSDGAEVRRFASPRTAKTLATPSVASSHSPSHSPRQRTGLTLT